MKHTSFVNTVCRRITRSYTFCSEQGKSGDYFLL